MRCEEVDRSRSALCSRARAPRWPLDTIAARAAMVSSALTVVLLRAALELRKHAPTISGDDALTAFRRRYRVGGKRGLGAA
jgi:hypothetical protein